MEQKKAQPSKDTITIPSYLDIPTGIFEDVQHYKKVASNMIKALTLDSDGTSYLFDGLEVNYKKEQTHESIFLDHLNSKIVIQAPVAPNENEETLRKRTMFYHMELLKSVEQMKVHGISSIYLVLSEEGRKKLALK